MDYGDTNETSWEWISYCTAEHQSSFLTARSGEGPEHCKFVFTLSTYECSDAEELSQIPAAKEARQREHDKSGAWTAMLPPLAQGPAPSSIVL